VYRAAFVKHKFNFFLLYGVLKTKEESRVKVLKYYIKEGVFRKHPQLDIGKKVNLNKLHYNLYMKNCVDHFLLCCSQLCPYDVSE
jgi:hypothetical protein